MKTLNLWIGAFLAAAGLAGCSSAYYASSGYASDDLYALPTTGRRSPVSSRRRPRRARPRPKRAAPNGRPGWPKPRPQPPKTDITNTTPIPTGACWPTITRAPMPAGCAASSRRRTICPRAISTPVTAGRSTTFPPTIRPSIT